MSHTVSRTRGRVLVAVVLASALVLPGCAAGKIAQTAQEVASENGGNGTIGHIDVLNAQLETPPGNGYAKGESAPLSMWISNDGLAADELTQVTTPAAAKVVIAGPAITQARSLEDFGTKYKIIVTGLAAPLGYGVAVPLTFTFKTAGTVTVDAPVAIPSQRTPGRPSVQIVPTEPKDLWQTGSAPGQG